MTWTYNLADLQSADETVRRRTRLRLRIGDTIPKTSHHLLQDEEIDVMLSEVSDDHHAALKAARYALGKLTRETDANGAGIQVVRSQRVQHLKDLLKELQVENANSAQTFMGSQDLSSDADNGASFSIGVLDHPGRSS